ILFITQHPNRMTALGAGRVPPIPPPYIYEMGGTRRRGPGPRLTGAARRGNVLYGKQVDVNAVVTGGELERSIEIGLQFSLGSQEREQFIQIFGRGLADHRRAALLHSGLLRQIEFKFKSLAGDPSRLRLIQTRLIAEDGGLGSCSRI